MSSYTAISAKVRAMYGCRMTGEDYRQLMGKRTVAEAAAFLQSHPGYRRELALPSGEIRREALENALRRSYFNEYRRIFRFLSIQDRDILWFPIYRAEKDAILAAMRRLSSSRTLESEAVWAPMLQKKSRLNLSSLSHAATFAQIAEAAGGTIYGSALQRCVLSGQSQQSVAFVDNLLLVTYYAQLYKIMTGRYAGDAKKVLKQSLDEETDLLNLVEFLRLKKHFSQEDVQLYSFPLPASRKLPRSDIQQLLSAADFDEAFSMVCDGPYGKLFRSVTPKGLEAYLYTLQYRFNQRQLRSAVPTIYTPIAYLALKEIELRNIISIIECIRYGANPEAYVTLIGVYGHL